MELMEQIEDDVFDPEIEKHDSKNFEMKLEYSLNDKIKKNRFSLDAYFFIPRSLNINKTNYEEKEFYSDLTIYSRFKTPQISLSGLVNMENALSPFPRIYKYILQIENGGADVSTIENLDYELRLMSNITKVVLRDQFQFLTEEIKKADTGETYEKLIHMILDFAEEINRFQGEKAKLYQKISNPLIPANIRETANFCNEFIGQKILYYGGKFYKKAILKYKVEIHDAKKNADKELFVLMEKIMENEISHRRTYDNKLKMEKGEKNESFSYWESILKKFVQKILYLNVTFTNWRAIFLQFLYSFAAGIAMYISLYLTFYSQNRNETNSTSLIMALVLTYILKDRIKDIIKLISNKAAGIYIPDRVFKIIDPHEQSGNALIKIGVGKDTVYFTKWSNVPEEVVKLREFTNKSNVERDGKPEVILKYQRNITLQTKIISKYHERSSDINDIIRFNIRNFLKYADDPVHRMYLWNPEIKELEKITHEKTYHLNIILKLSKYSKSGEDISQYKKVRVIFNQKGITSVEDLPVLL